MPASSGAPSEQQQPFSNPLAGQDLEEEHEGGANPLFKPASRKT